jgi:hypothetical protein
MITTLFCIKSENVSGRIIFSSNGFQNATSQIFGAAVLILS